MAVHSTIPRTARSGVIARLTRMLLFAVLAAGLTPSVVIAEPPAPVPDAGAAPARDSGVAPAPLRDAGVVPAPAPDAGLAVAAPTTPYVPPASTHLAPRLALPLHPRAGAPVVVIPIDGTIDLGLSAFVERVILEHPDAAAFVLDVNTLGGRVDAAIRIRDALLRTHIPTVAFIDPRAISAGALISLACDVIVMRPDASIGAVTPFAQGGGTGSVKVDEKMISYMRTEMRATAEANGRRGDVAEAMVDPDASVPGVIEAGKLLTLDAERAIELGMADARARDLDGALTVLGLEQARLVQTHENWGEQIARVVTGPTLSGLLLSVGMLALLASFYSRSFGPLTVLGLSALVVFFAGHAVVHLVGWEEAILFAVGLTLLALEVFVIPGFGVAGVAGIACLVTSLVLSMLALPLGVSLELGVVGDAIARVSVSLLAALAVGAILLKVFPRTRTGRALVLGTSLPSGAGYVSATRADDALVGARGEALTALKPSGRVVIGGRRLDARSERAYIDRGDKVVVVRVEGAHLVVRPERAAPAEEERA